jgi:single-strand DNA-binding protein
MSELKFPEVNRVMLSGRLTRDPEHRYASDGTQVTNFTMAFHRRYRGSDGRPAEQTGYIVVMTYARLAEVCAQYLRRGNAVLVEGRLQMREWTATQGEKRQRLELRADLVHFLEKAPISADAGGETAEAGADPPEEGELF